MNQKLINIILLALIIILAGALIYVISINKTVLEDNVQYQEVSNSIPLLREAEALTLVKSTWGDCAPDSCSEVVVSITKQDSETYVVTAIYEGLRDDSSSAQKKVATASYVNGTWILGTATVTQKCQPGRGHQNFSSELCL